MQNCSKLCPKEIFSLEIRDIFKPFCNKDSSGSLTAELVLLFASQSKLTIASPQNLVPGSYLNFMCRKAPISSSIFDIVTPPPPAIHLCLSPYALV